MNLKWNFICSITVFVRIYSGKEKGTIHWKLSSIYFYLSIFYTHVRINNEATVKLLFSQELVMEFCACIDFVIILWGNLRPLKWKKILWNCIIFRNFNPATIIEPLINGREGLIFYNIRQKEHGSDFSYKKGGDGKGIVLKKRGVSNIFIHTNPFYCFVS